MLNRFIWAIRIITSIVISILICELNGEKWEETIRESYYSIIHDTLPCYHKTYTDSLGIPFIYYEELNRIRPGKQYNPTSVAIYAKEYYDSLSRNDNPVTRHKFYHCIDWLEKNIHNENGFYIYQFDWQQPFYPDVKPPYTSGLSSGMAIEAFTDAYLLSDSAKYISLAKKLLSGFYLTIQKGGFTYIDSTGMWFEEYACKNTKTPRVLNGHISALLGVKSLCSITKDDSARFIFNKGLQSLKKYLPEYDAQNGDSYYDSLNKIADKHYQKVIITQMQTLWEITNDKEFLYYYKKWQEPLNNLYVYKIIKEKNKSGIILLGIFFSASLLLFSVLFRIPGKINSQKEAAQSNSA